MNLFRLVVKSVLKMVFGLVFVSVCVIVLVLILFSGGVCLVMNFILGWVCLSRVLKLVMVDWLYL